MTVEISDSQIDVSRKRHKYSIADVAAALSGRKPLSSAVEDGSSPDDGAPLPTGNDDDDEDEDYDEGSFKELVKSDSIKRAILDLHRNVKVGRGSISRLERRVASRHSGPS